MSTPRKIVNYLQEFSVPLIGGVLAALVFANVDPKAYHHLVEWDWITPGVPDAEAFHAFGYRVTLHWFVNDVFMVFFFGIAAKEITEATLPGGSLNPPRKAINPLFATVGGVAGPVAAFFGGLWAFDALGWFAVDADMDALARGWGVPTATDIALAWLVARTVFGASHPAVNFLLLLAVADDAIGLGIIAIFYGDPSHPARPEFLGLVLAGIGLAWGMRRVGVGRWWPYVLIAGPFSWVGLNLAHLHPALALVPIVPFIPGPERDTGLFVDDEEQGAGHAHSPLHQLEHDTKIFVDFGLFFFAFANAGVEFAGIGAMTWLILGALVFGKTLGVALCSHVASLLGFPLPDRMTARHLYMAGFIASLGLTVALFVAGAAFTDSALRGQAKMGALFSGLAGIVAVAVARVFPMKGRD